MWKALLALLGTVVGAMAGYVIGFFGSYAVFVVLGLKGPVIDLSVCFGVPAGGAVFSLLGFWFGCKLDARSPRTASPRKWTAAFASLGAAVGPPIGFYAASKHVCRHAEPGNHWRELDALAAGLFCGVPVGGIFFCLLGFCFGLVLDELLRHASSSTGGSVST